MNSNLTSDKMTNRTPVLVAGKRTPFMRSNGHFADLSGFDLGRYAVAGLLNDIPVPPKEVEAIIMGTVISDPKTSNIAREIALSTPMSAAPFAFSTTMACISANVAATSLCDMIRLGHISSGIAGGTETFSDPPIRCSKKMRQTLARSQKAKGLGDYLKLLKTLKPRDLLPEVPTPTEFSTGQTMGAGCERMIKAFSVSRKESDDFALRSHKCAQDAYEKGHYKDDVLSIQPPPRFKPANKDDSIRADTTPEKMAKLKPVFDRTFGVNTAANSSGLCDGASALLFMSQEKASQAGLKALSVVADYVYTGSDPLDELLLGPAYAIPKLLERCGLKAKDIGIWEIHEAFASQVVANLKALESKTFCTQTLGLKEAVGEIPMDKINAWGGSLSLGHPFGATGGRLMLTASRRLIESGEKYAIVTGCAAGALGSAILLQNPNSL